MIVEAEAEAAGYMQLPLLCLTMASRALYRDTPAAGRCFSRHRVTCDAVGGIRIGSETPAAEARGAEPEACAPLRHSPRRLQGSK